MFVSKERQIMSYLEERVFNPVLETPRASAKLKNGVRYTIMRLNQRDAAGMVSYFWSAIAGTEKAISFSALMKKEGFDRFEEALEDFRVRFDGRFLSRAA